VPALGQALLDQDAGVSYQAAVALSRLGAAAVPELVKGLKADRMGVRVAAADALRHLGADARAAVPALVAALEDPEAGVLRAAGRALKKIDPEAAARAGIP
jgi:HEAT repeat protein